METKKLESSWLASLQAAFPHTLPILASTAALGMTYGMLMRSVGYGVHWSLAMSIIAFCGSMQFAAIPYLTSLYAPLEVFVLSLLVNARHIFYGIPMLEKFKGTGKIRPFLIYTLSDESFSLFCTVEPPLGVEKKYFYFWLTLLIAIYWCFGALLGGLLGGLITFDLKGLDFAMTALFIVLFLEQCAKKENRPAAAIGMLCAIACLFIFGADNFMIPAMLAMAVVLFLGRSKLCS